MPFMALAKRAPRTAPTQGATTGTCTIVHTTIPVRKEQLGFDELEEGHIGNEKFPLRFELDGQRH